MKTKSGISQFLFAGAIVALLASCSGNNKEAAHDHSGHSHDAAEENAKEASAPQFTVDQSFQKQLAGLFSAYVSLKDAFVSSNAQKVQAEANKTTEALAGVDMSLLSGPAHNDWMNYQSGLKSSLAEISKTTDLEEQRKSFSELSDSLYKSIKAFGLGGKEAFYEYCPMAFNNEGGYWLSDQEKIRNPYFGDKMLTCGSVKEKLN